MKGKALEQGDSVLSPQHSALEKVACPLCGADEPRLLVAGRDLMLGQPGAFPLNECGRCGLVYLSPRPRDPSPFYGGGYVPHRRAAASPLARLRAEIQRRQIVRYVRAHAGAGDGRRALDVGCATGTFLAALRGDGWDVWGVEPGADAAAYARARLGPQILHGSLEQARLPERGFHLITLWDVIEHLPDPAATLRHIRRLLAPGGAVVIQTPRWGCLESRLFGSAWIGLDPPRHTVVFSGRTLARMLRECGLAPREVPALASSFQNWALSLRFALAQRIGVRPAARAYRLIASPVARAWSWPLIAALDRGRYPAQLAVVATAP
jgi:SAM-dependent methyltransferase